MKVYLSGPMTGLPEWNYPAFNEAAARLRDAGFEVVNPAENRLPADAPWTAHMREDIAQMMRCEGLVMLPGWMHSKGAKLENLIASRLGFPIAELETVLAFQARPACPICRSQLDEGGGLVVPDGAPLFEAMTEFNDPEWAALAE